MNNYNNPGDIDRSELHKGGRFPIGDNNCWHSGIHIYISRNEMIKPLISGWLAAYRINEDYQTVPLSNEISGAALANLKSHTIALYHNQNEESDKHKNVPEERRRYTLIKETLTKEEESKLKDKITRADYESLPEDMKIFYNGNLELHKERRSLYCWDGNSAFVPVNKITTNFILLKHKCKIPDSGIGTKEIEFFTLYMGLMPGVSDGLKSYYGAFIRGNGARKPFAEKLPFYQTWRFKIEKHDTDDAIRFYYETEESKEKIFHGSHCSITEKDDLNYECKFVNIRDKKVIHKDCIEVITEEKLIPKSDHVPIYHIRPDQNNRLFKIGELKKEGTYFNTRNIVAAVEAYKGTHSQVRVNTKTELHPSNGNAGYIWWIKGAVKPGDEKKYETSMQIFYKNNDAASYRQHYKIVGLYEYIEKNRYTGMKRSTFFGWLFGCDMEYDAMSVELQLSGDKKIASLKYTRHQNGGRNIKTAKYPRSSPLIIVESGSKPQGISLYYYYNGTRIEAVTETNDSLFEGYQGRGEGVLGNSLSVACLAKLPDERIVAGEYLKIEDKPLAGERDSLPESLQRDENLYPCRLAYKPYENATTYPALVNKNDLKVQSGTGRLHIVGGAINGLDLKEGKGVIVYDGPSDDSNARDILLEGAEFEMKTPSLYSAERRDIFYAVDYWDGSTKYVNLNGVELAAGVFYKKDYKGNGNRIKKQEQAINMDDILGYPNEHRRDANLSFYDLACFFVDRSFLDDAGNNESIMRYLIQPGAKLYKPKTVNIQERRGFITWGSTFECEEAGSGKERVYKLTVQSVNAFISFGDMLPAHKEKINSVQYKKNVKYALPEFAGIKELIFSEANVKIDYPAGWDDNLKWLGTMFPQAWKNLEKVKFEFIDRAESGNPRFNFRFSTTPGDPASLGVTLWVKPEGIDSKVEKIQEASKTILKVKRGQNIVNLSYWEENPYEVEFEASEEMPETGEYCMEAGTRRGKSQKMYIQLQARGGRVFYAMDDGKGNPDGFKAVDLLDWKGRFIIGGADGEGRVFCSRSRLEEIIGAVKRGDGSAKKALEAGNLFSGGVSVGNFLKIYSGGASLKPIVHALRRLICSHPLEWDKALYKYDDFQLMMGEKRFEQLSKEIELMDLWKGGGSEGVNDAAGSPGKNSFWFAHPVYFISHLDEAGLLDASFNPYLGKNFPERNVKVTVIANPGFAPDAKSGRINHMGKYYAETSGLFNENYAHLPVYSKQGYTYYFHEGVDFYGSTGTAITSFVYAEVLAYGRFGSYGNTLILANKKEKGVYLLAHLSAKRNGLEKGAIVEPYEIVAYVGNTTKPEYQPMGAHLHLSYYDYEYQDKKPIVTENGGELSWMSEWKPAEYLRDPFTHIDRRREHIK